MRSIFSSLVFLSLSFLSLNSFASSISVNGLQGPAWIERNNQKQVLTPDTKIQANDIVITGENGKLWLNMEDGAVIKLGNAARMKVQNLSAKEDANTQISLLEASVEIVEGAFRYTTGFVSSQTNTQWNRQVNIGLSKTAAIGIRGTDLWGKVGSDNQFVVLLEGKINVTPNTSGATPVILDQALQIFKMENNQALPVNTVDMEAVKSLAPETELDFGLGVQQQGSAYRLHLASSEWPHKARALLDKLKEQGYAANMVEVEVNEMSWSRIYIDEFVSREDAESLAESLRDDVDIISPWIQRM